MIAALPMYDRPETAAANDRFWAAIRDALRADGIDAPSRLTRPKDLWALWQSPDLLLAQTCGYPYRARLHGHVSLVGTPDYGLPGCPPGYYNSVFVARRQDATRPLAAFADRGFAYNEALSQSGWAAPRHHAPFLGAAKLVQTGGHRLSALAVAEGRADLAALDAQTWRMIQTWDDFASGLTVVARTTPTPGLPLICARGQPCAQIARSVTTAVHALPPADQRVLGLRALIHIPKEAYLAVPTPPAPGQSRANLPDS